MAKQNVSENDFRGLRVAVTGGTSGLGLAIVRKMHERGAQVAFVARRREGVDRVMREYPGVQGIVGDVSNKDDIHRIAVQIVGLVGGLDVLINNAAIVPHFAWRIPRWPKIAEMPLEFWNNVVRTNLYGTFFGAKHVIPHMEKRRSGHIINLYGGGGLTPAGACTYMVTKDGIRTFTRYLAEEVRDANICVVTFSPRVPIATETAPQEARQRLPGPDILGQGFVLAAQLPLEQSGKCVAYENGKLVDEQARDG